ncbi:MAG: biotin/lipoyl-containing protein, partial [Halopseudomonas sp.]
MPVAIKLPAVTADFEAGTIGSWCKSVGDKIEQGDVIFEVETDKAAVEVEAEESGVLGKILVQEGEEDIEVDTVVGLLLVNGETSDVLDGFDASSAPAEAKSNPTDETPAAVVETNVDSDQAAGDFRASVEIKLPAVTADFEAGIIGSWQKSVGDKVEQGDVIFEVETDKAVVEVEAEDSGVLGQIIVEDSEDEIAVGTVVGLLLVDGETSDARDGFKASSVPAEEAKKAEPN